MSGILSKIGIGKPMDYMMLIQSILVLVATIFTIYSLASSLILNNFAVFTLGSSFASNCFDGFSQIVYCAIALMLLTYSLHLSYKGKDSHFTIIMTVYAICVFRFALFQLLPINILRVIELLCIIYFIYLLIDPKDFKKAKKLMLVILILVIICNLLTSFLGGTVLPTFEVFIIQISVAFTFFVRFLRNNCPEIAM